METVRCSNSSRTTDVAGGSSSSSPNSSSNTSSVSSGSSSSTTSGGEHSLYAASKHVLIELLQLLIGHFPPPHHQYKRGGGNKYSDRVNQVLSDARVATPSSSGQQQLVRVMLEQLLPCCSSYLHTLHQLPWRQQLQPTHAHALLRAALLGAEYLTWSLQGGNGSVCSVALCLECISATLSCGSLWQRLAQADHNNYVLTMVAAVHMAVEHLMAPHQLPSIPAVSASPAVSPSAYQLIQLVLWLEEGGDHKMVPRLQPTVRSIIMGLGRCPCLNGVVRCPPDLWTAGWTPPLGGELPPPPPHLLQEQDILHQFIYRAQLFGWVSRQQFEETWMSLLSVVGAQDEQEQEQRYRDQCVCVCVRGLSGLLLLTLIHPTPGNPHAAVQHTDNTTTRGSAAAALPVQHVLQQLHERHTYVRHLTAASDCVTDGWPSDGATSWLPLSVIASGLDDTATAAPANPHSYNTEDSSPHRSQLSAMGIDLSSCTHFLQDLFKAWVTAEAGLCSSVVCEVAKCLCVLVELVSSGDQVVWVLTTCVALTTTHPAEDTTTHHYLMMAAAKAMAISRLAQLKVGSATSDGILHMLEAGLKSASSAVKTCALHGLLLLLQPTTLPLHTATTQPLHTTTQPPHTTAKTTASTLSSAATVVSAAGGAVVNTPRAALTALTSHMRGAAATPLTPQQQMASPIAAPGDHVKLSTAAVSEDSFLQSLVDMGAAYVIKACDTRVCEGESHSLAAWDVCLCLVEHHASLLRVTPLPTTALHLALATAAAHTTTTPLLHKVLDGVDRLLAVPLPELQSTATTEVVHKLVMDLVQHGPPTVSLPALPLYITLLYAVPRSSGEPEVLLQLLEKLCVLFERLKTGYQHEAWLLSGLLSTCLLDLLPASQVMNKVITEFISPHQPRPHLLAGALFQVFERCMQEGGCGLVQEWVLMSLGNFTHQEPVTMAVWCMTCFLVAASKHVYLRAAFPAVVAWPAQFKQRQHCSTQSGAVEPWLESAALSTDQLQLFCFAAADFSSSLPTQQHRNKFREVFINAPHLHFAEMLQYLDASRPDVTG